MNPPEFPEDVPEWKIRLDVRNARGHLEWAYEEGMKAQAKFLSAIKDVHDKRTYRFDYVSFEEYMQKVWKISKPRAYQLLSSGEFFDDIDHAGGADVLPMLTEGSVREVKDLGPHKVIKAARKLIKAGEKITAKKLKQALKPETVIDLVTCPCCNSKVPQSAIKQDLMVTRVTADKSPCE